MIQLTPDFNATANKASSRQPGYLPLQRVDKAREALAANGKGDIAKALIQSRVKSGEITSVTLGSAKLLHINSNGEVSKLAQALIGGSIDPTNLATAGRIAERFNQPYAAVVDALGSLDLLPSGVVTKMGGEMYSLEQVMPQLMERFGIAPEASKGPRLLTPQGRGVAGVLTAASAPVVAAAVEPRFALTAGASSASAPIVLPLPDSAPSAAAVAGAPAPSKVAGAFGVQLNIKAPVGDVLAASPITAPATGAKKSKFGFLDKGKEMAAKFTQPKATAAPAAVAVLTVPAAPLIGAPAADLIQPAGTWSLSGGAAVVAPEADQLTGFAKHFQPPVFGGNPTPSSGSGSRAFEKSVAKAAQVTGKAKAPAIVLGGIAAAGTIGAGVLAGAANGSPTAFVTTGAMTAAGLGTYAIIGARADAKLAAHAASGIATAVPKLGGKATAALAVGAAVAGVAGTLALPEGDVKSGFKAATLATTAVSGALAVGSMILGKGGSARVFRTGALVSGAMLAAEFGATAIQRGKKPAPARPAMTPVVAVTKTEGK